MNITKNNQLTMKGSRTYITLSVSFLAATSALLLSLGVIDTGLTPEQLTSIENFLLAMVAFSAPVAAYFRSIAHK